MIRAAQRSILALGILAASSCTTTDEQEAKPLDVAIAKLPAQAKRIESEKSGKIVLQPSEIIDWRQFFKPPPNRRERSLLERKLTVRDENLSTKELIKRGRNEVALGRFVAADVNFRMALRKNPDSVDALLESAQFYIRTKDYDKAFDFLTKLKGRIDTDPSVSAVLAFRYKYILSLGYLARGETQKGHKILSDLIAIDRKFSPGYVALATSYLQDGKDAIAQFVAKRGVDRGGDDAALLNVLGVLKQRAGEGIAARRNFDKALKISPTYSPAIVNRANQMIAKHEFDAAEAELQKAISYSPANVSAFVSLGICLKKMGRHGAARNAFTKAIELQPDNAAARFNMGVLMVNHFKKPNVALRLFTEVLQTRDRNHEVKRMAQLYIDGIRENSLTSSQ